MAKAGGYSGKGKKDRKKAMDEAGSWNSDNKYHKPASGKFDKGKY